jgi:hypothetical protein
MDLGEKLTLWSFAFNLLGTRLILAGIVIGLVASRYTDRGYLERLKSLAGQVLESRTRKQPE